MKKNINDELDLLDIFLTVWNNKWKLLLFVLLAMVLMFIYLKNQPPRSTVFKATTEIKPISIFDASKYETYNGYLTSISQKKKIEDAINVTKGGMPITTTIDISSFRAIDRSYLLDLFIDRLDENSVFIDGIKKFNLVNKDNYQNTQDYEKEVLKFSTSIKLLPKLQISNNNISIQAYISDQETWEKFLIYINEITNQEVRKYLNETFNKVILNEKTFKNYQIEDIEIELLNLITDKQKTILKKQKKLLEANKDIERLQKLFETTPIIKSNSFYAGRIMVPTTKYENVSKSRVSKLKMMVLAVVLGGIFGIFYILISKAIQKKSISSDL